MGGLWPLTSGGRQRSFHTLAQLARRHDVTVVTTHAPGEDGGRLAAELPARATVISVPFAPPKQGTLRFAASLAASWCTADPVDLHKWTSAGVRRAASTLLAERTFDLVVADFLSAVPNVPRSTRCPTVLFEHNVEYLIWKRLCDLETRWWRRLPLAIEWRKLRRREIQACRAASMTIAVSDDDARRLADLAPGARVLSVPTGVDVDYFTPGGGPQVPNRLVFSGSMDWYPNEDAMLHFVEAILPLVRREVPDASLTIVGRRPSAKVQALARQAGVQVTGTVDDVRTYVGEAPVYVVPLRAGGGTRLKIFEALAMGKPVVSTTVGAEGLALQSGRDVVIADTPEAFSAAVVRLLREPAEREAIGAAGRALVEARYSWASVTRAFERGLQDAVAGAGAVRDVREARAFTEA